MGFKIQKMAREIRWRGVRALALNSGPGMAGRFNPGLVVGLVLFVAAALCPFLLSEFKVGLIGLGLTYGLFAVGLDLAWGRTGIVSIGHAVFFGLGVYGVAIALTRHFSPELGGLIGILLAAALGVLTAAVGQRRATNPSTMAVLTLAITLLAEKIARDWWSVTGGSSGLYVPPLAETNAYYWICLAVMFGVVALLWLTVLNRPLGNRLTAIRLNDQRAEHLGIPIFRERVVALHAERDRRRDRRCLSAPWMSSVSPDRVGIVLSTQVLVWVAIGGKNTILGPVLGAVAATYGQDALASTLGEFYLLILGLLFILSVLLVPAGIAGIFRSGPQLAQTTPRRRARRAPRRAARRRGARLRGYRQAASPATWCSTASIFASRRPRSSASSGRMAPARAPCSMCFPAPSLRLRLGDAGRHAHRAARRRTAGWPQGWPARSKCRACFPGSA